MTSDITFAQLANLTVIEEVKTGEGGDDETRETDQSTSRVQF